MYTEAQKQAYRAKHTDFKGGSLKDGTASLLTFIGGEGTCLISLEDYRPEKRVPVEDVKIGDHYLGCLITDIYRVAQYTKITYMTRHGESHHTVNPWMQSTVRVAQH